PPHLRGEGALSFGLVLALVDDDDGVRIEGARRQDGGGRWRGQESLQPAQRRSADAAASLGLLPEHADGLVERTAFTVRPWGGHGLELLGEAEERGDDLVTLLGRKRGQGGVDDGSRLEPTVGLGYWRLIG